MFAVPPLPTFSNPFADAASSDVAKITLESEAGDTFPFPFNPTSFSMDRQVAWEDSKAMKEAYGILNFTGGSSDSITFRTLLDCTESSEDDASILEDVQKLYKMTENSEEDNNYKRPPIVKLTWGDDFQFIGVITSLKVGFTMFSKDGRPLRADVDMTLKGRTFNEDLDASKFFSPFSTV